MAREDDQKWVRRLLVGDSDAFVAFFERLFPRVYRYVSKRVASTEDIEAVTAEALSDMLDDLHRYRGERPFDAWALCVTQRAVARAQARERADAAG